jgi:hypothetical protein
LPGQVSETKSTSVSALIRNAIEKLLDREEQAKLDELYAAMENAKAICKDNVTDASTTIDEVLYGENGVWRGSAE